MLDVDTDFLRLANSVTEDDDVFLFRDFNKKITYFLDDNVEGLVYN